MAAIFWDDSFSVKIEIIDNQHKRLFEMINEFYDGISKGINTQSTLKLIDGMKAYAIMHFSTEERYMKKFNFANYEEHKKEHDEFVKKVESLEKKVKQGTVIISFEITNFLKDWIKNHINQTDKQYSDLLVQNGVK